jgi:SAM-dependent methyltransferase
VTALEYIGELHCPYCGLDLEAEPRSFIAGPQGTYGVVHCGCYRYPVVADILILKQQPGSFTGNRAVQCIEAGDPAGALEYALSGVSPVPHARRTSLGRTLSSVRRRVRALFPRLSHQVDQKVTVRRLQDNSLTFREALSVLRPGLYSQYLYHRYANNSFIASIAPLLLLKELDTHHATGTTESSSANSNNRKRRRVLDLACGVGHSSFLMASLFPGLSVTAADHDFVNLYIGRRYLIHGVTSICIDAEVPLPFASDSFDAVFCLDGFHYIHSKVALISELNRVLDPFALWLFPHLHNAEGDNPVAGRPLSYRDYLRCFKFLQPRILPENRVLQDLITHQSLDLEASSSEAAVRGSDVFTLIASRRSDLWRKHTDIGSLLWDRGSTLTVNPIYRVIDEGEKLRLLMNWPNKRLEEECQTIKQYLPFECEVEKPLLQRATEGRLERKDEMALQKLIRSFVLVRLPSAYTELGVN